MSDPILGGAKVVAGTFKNLVVDRIVEYLRFMQSYEDNMIELRKELKDLCVKKLDLEAKVMKGKQNLEVMTRQTANWLENVIDVIEGGEMKMLIKEKGVAEIVVKVMERNALKNLWQEDRELFDIVINVVKKECSHQEAGDREVVRAEKDADYKKVAKVASDVMKDIAEEFTKFIQSEDAAVAVVKQLNDEDLKKLTKEGDEMAIILSKAEGVIRNKIESNDHDEKALLLPKDNEDVQPVDKSTMKENVGMWRKHMGNLMTFMDDDNFKKGLPDAARVGLEVIDAISKSPGSEQVEANGKPHRYCGSRVLHFENYRHRHDMSQIAEVMVTDIKSMILKYPLDPVTRDRRDGELDIIPGEFADGLESREVLVRKILVALKDDQVNIVGVYGMGGCGKTTLAKEVAYKRATDLFNKRVVVEVSEVPNIKGIQNQIAGGVGLILDDMNTIAQRASKLYTRLKSEKILIILDNVWKKLKLDVVGIPHESSNDFCCKLLITTREKQVCSKLMNVQESNIFMVGLLNEREALNLFENQSEKNVGNGVFKLVADRLLLKCGGLPLAIATTASSLRGKKLPIWYHFAETSEKPIWSQVSSEYRETYSILETSYKLIDIEEKKIFLYLACLSPLDSAITVNDLMRYGIGLDLFQHVNGLSEAMEEATTWATELISSSLLIKGDSNGEVKIHDLVRSSSISFIDKGKDRKTLVESIPRWICEETFEKFTAISLMSGHDFSRLSGVKAPMLEILLLKGDISSTILPSNFFEGMENLKVLSLSNVKFNMGLPESMGQLDRLKTLHLHNCKLRDVKLIGKLVNLLVLSLRGSSLEELAVEIGELYKLRLLDIEGCKGMKRIPANILSRLSNLEGLYTLNGFDDWASTNMEVNDGGWSNQASGSELDRLSHLNVLEMEVSKTEQLLTVNNAQLIEQLGKFKIRVRNSNGSHEELPDELHYVLELIDIDPSPNNGLRTLLKKTECLVLRHCNRLTKNVVPELDEDGFKDIKYLKVQYCELQFIISSDEQNGSIAFENLEILELLHMDYLEKICDGKASVGIFSNLRRLTLCDLFNLKCGLPLTSVLLKLNEVSVERCRSLKFLAYKDAKTAKNQIEVDMFPCLKSIYLFSVDKLSSVVEQSGNEEFALFNAENWVELCAAIPVDGQDGPPDVCVIELGGTIGDIESMPFIEAIGQFSYRVGPGNFCLVHVSLVPVLNVVGEQKTKPTQHSVRGLRGLGLTPDMLACRSKMPLDENVKAKLSQFCHVTDECIITLYDVPNIWHIPLLLRGAHEAILKVLNLDSSSKQPVLDEWTQRAQRCDMLHKTVTIAMVGKYTGLSDSYLSVLKGADGVLVPGGFGDRGVEGKILAAKYARENKIPYLGICLGMQIAVVEFARSVLGVQDASSTEFDKDSKSPYIIFMPESKYPSFESLELLINDTIQTLWSRTSYVSSFQGLKIVRLSCCYRLCSLGSPSMFAALVQLEELKIYKCHGLQEVISKETEGDIILEKAINFPKLKHLSLQSSRGIERLYRGSYNLKFPNLKSLHLTAIDSFTNFDGSENSTTLFSDKIEFLCLEELDVQDVSSEVLRLWNWSSSSVQGESEGGNISLNPVPNLQILRLGNISLNQGLVSIPHSVSHTLSHLNVNNFNNIKSLFSVLAVSGEAFCTYSQLPNLKNLSVGDCESLEQLFHSEDKDVISLCERLIEITLHSLPKLKIVSMHLLKNIHTLSISGLRWNYVFTIDLFIKGKEQLQLLESLEIASCGNMEVIIKDELVGDSGESVYNFPRLKILTIWSLSITKFASKPNTRIQFPSLESIELMSCENIESFWSGSFMAPKLKQVQVEDCGNMQCFLSKKRNEVRELSFLERVEIKGCLRLLSFSLEPLVAPKLHHVTLEGCPEMKWFLRGDPNNNDIVELPSLGIVSIERCKGMKSFSSGRMKVPKLCELKVDYKDYSKRANEELQYMLAILPKYYIREEKESKDEGDESIGEIWKLWSDGPQDEQNTNTDGDEELEELLTEKQGNDTSQEEQSME